MIPSKPLSLSCQVWGHLQPHCHSIGSAMGPRCLWLPWLIPAAIVHNSSHCRRILSTSEGYYPLQEDTVHFRRILSTAGGYYPLQEDTVHFRRILSTAGGYCPPSKDTIHFQRILSTAGVYVLSMSRGHCPLPEDAVHCRRILSTSEVYYPLPEDTVHCQRIPILSTAGGYCPLPEDTVHFRRILSSHLCSGPLLTPIVYIWYIINGQNSENTIGEEEMSKNGKLIYKDSIIRKLVTLPVIKLKFKIWEFCLLN